MIDSPSEFCFSELARRYAEFLQTAFPVRRLAEDELALETPVEPNELEWQSRWFGGDFGRHFSTARGVEVKVIDFGWWNHGAGPDFREAVVEIGGVRRKGSIELDRTVRDWELHGHAENPAYEDVVLHLVLQRSGEEFFTRTSSHREVPQVVLNPGDASPRTQTPPPEARPGRCSSVLERWAAPRLNSLLEAAARFRLERKSARWRRMGQIHGWDQAAYQGFAEALGYSRNKLPMMVLAQRFPLKFLQARREECEALLFGAAGFLDGVSFDQSDSATRSYLRELWQAWWKLRPDFSAASETQALRWSATGVRPMNHPQRRVAALSEVAAQWKRLRSLLVPAASFAEDPFVAALDSIRHPYWDFHYTLTSKPAAKRMALIGGTRAADLLANVVYPLLIPEREALWARYCELSAPLDNEKARRAALRILGNRPDAASFTRCLYQQQALLQIHDDFCLADASACENCPFPEQLAQWA